MMQMHKTKLKWAFSRKRAIIFVVALSFTGILSQVSSGNPEVLVKQTVSDYKTVWDGIYTADQSLAGQAVYERHCAICHGEAASGQSGPQLHGKVFFENWREDTISALYRQIRATMPRRKPPLSDPDYLLVTTYILQENGFPDGGNTLSLSTMETIRIENKDGPKPLPGNSLVQVTGCLTDNSGNWTLTKASSPIRNRNPDPDRSATPEELEASLKSPLGNLTVNLTNFFMLGDFDPTSHVGHKMLARGALIRRPAGDRISLTGLDMVDVDCGN